MPITARYPSHLSRIQAAVQQVEEASTTLELQAAVMHWGVGSDAIRIAVIKKIKQLSDQSLTRVHVS